MTRKQIFEILFWISLIMGVILLIWYIFGNSPTELSIILTFLLTLLFKIWAISDDLKDFKHEMKFSFHKIKGDIDNIKDKGKR